MGWDAVVDLGEAHNEKPINRDACYMRCRSKNITGICILVFLNPPPSLILVFGEENQRYIYVNCI